MEMEKSPGISRKTIMQRYAREQETVVRSFVEPLNPSRWVWFFRDDFAFYDYEIHISTTIIYHHRS